MVRVGQQGEEAQCGESKLKCGKEGICIGSKLAQSKFQGQDRVRRAPEQ